MCKRRFQILALLIAFALPLSCAYSYYNAMVEADFLWRGLKYEASDLDDLYVDKQKNIDFGSSLFSMVFFLEDNLAQHFFLPSSITPLFEQKSSILRC